MQSRALPALCASLLSLCGMAQAAPAIVPARRVWDELEAKRLALSAAHEEFEVTRTTKYAGGEQSSRRQLILDLDGEKWRERAVSGSGDSLRVFDGQDLFHFEEGGDEYVRARLKPKSDELRPIVYQIADLDWSKAAERGRPSCSLGNVTHTCVVLEVPLKTKMGMPGAWEQRGRITTGVRGLTLDTETGLILASRTILTVGDPRGGYRTDTLYAGKTFQYGTPAEAALFRLPAGDLHEVKALSDWNSARIVKVLGGRPAPELTLTDLKGNQLTLGSLKGRTVLLDFWATWCGPCRADGPALDRLYQKYGAKDLAIVGISVSEDRSVVEKFLRDHPHEYPIALTTENEMPRPFQIGLFPTYMIVDREGNLAGAVEGDQGFSELRKLLKKAGLEAE